MIKKILILTALIATTNSCFADVTFVTMAPETPKQEVKKSPKDKLKLNDEQNQKAIEIREREKVELQPLLDKFNEKRQEARMVELSRIAPQMQEEKLAEIHKEMESLKTQMREIHAKYVAEFQALLTPKQEKALNKMKKEKRP